MASVGPEIGSMTSGPPPELTAPMSEQYLARLLHQRIVVLDGELDDSIGTRLCSQLFLLSADDPHSDISLWINSPGGSVPALRAIMDTMRLIPNDVSTLAIGIACSAGQFLLSAGAKGKRFALPHTRILMHQGSAGIGGGAGGARGKRFALPHTRILMHQGSAGIGGSAPDIELQADALRYTRDTVLA